MKSRFVFVLLVFSMIVAACAPQETPTPAPTAIPEPTQAPTEAPVVEEKTIVDIAVEDGRFTTLVTAVQAAELAETLSGEGPFTVFAPTDDAFAALPAGTLDSLLLPENKQQLTDILLYHVVAGQVMAADVVGLDGQMADTALTGKQIGIKVDMGDVYLNENVKVIARYALQELGHTWGVHHCLDPRCAMYPHWTPSYLTGDAIFCTFCREQTDQKVSLAKS